MQVLQVDRYNPSRIHSGCFFLMWNCTQAAHLTKIIQRWIISMYPKNITGLIMPYAFLVKKKKTLISLAMFQTRGMYMLAFLVFSCWIQSSKTACKLKCSWESWIHQQRKTAAFCSLAGEMGLVAEWKAKAMSTYGQWTLCNAVQLNHLKTYFQPMVLSH